MNASQSKRQIRILHLPHNVGGHPGGLSKAERKLGAESKVLIFADSKFKYFYDQLVEIDGAPTLLAEFRRWHVFLKSLFYYDVFHFNFGQKFLNFPVGPSKSGESLLKSFKRLFYYFYSKLFGEFDLWLIKILNKKIIVTFQGDDIRQGDFAKAHFPIHFVHEIRPGYYEIASDIRKRAITRIWDKYADSIFALNPDLLRVLPKRAMFFPYSHINLDEWTPIPPDIRAGKKIRILHAPSDRQVKGTHYILAALEKVKQRGFEFEIVLIEGLTFSEARKEYERADLVIDQVLAGWFGGFAVEAMALGKPVVAYIRNEDLQGIDSKFLAEMPIIQSAPDTLEDVICDCLESPEDLYRMGQRSRAFVEKWYDSGSHAQRLLQNEYLPN